MDLYTSSEGSFIYPSIMLIVLAQSKQALSEAAFRNSVLASHSFPHCDPSPSIRSLPTLTNVIKCPKNSGRFLWEDRHKVASKYISISKSKFAVSLFVGINGLLSEIPTKVCTDILKLCFYSTKSLWPIPFDSI